MLKVQMRFISEFLVDYKDREFCIASWKKLAIKNLFFQLSLWLESSLFFHLWIIYQVRFTYSIKPYYPAMNRKALEEAGHLNSSSYLALPE